jgi:hypothetical protein
MIVIVLVRDGESRRQTSEAAVVRRGDEGLPSDGRSVGIVSSRTQVTEFQFGF